MAVNPVVQKYLDAMQTPTSPAPAVRYAKPPEVLQQPSTGVTTITAPGAPSSRGLGGQIGASMGVGSWRPSTGNGWEGLKPEAQQWIKRTLDQWGSQGLSFSSGYRDPAHNAAVNGVPNSGHTRGWKADFSGNSQLLGQVANWLREQGARTLLHDAGSGYHLDVSWEDMYK